MKLFDVHSHWGTERGYPLRTPAELAQQRKTWNSSPKFVSESELAEKVPAEPIIMLEKEGKDVIGDILKEMQ